MKQSITEVIEKARENAKRWYYANKEKALESRKKYYSENAEAIKKRVRQYGVDNKEKISAYNKERSKTEKRQAQTKERQKKHYEAHKQEYIDRAKEWDKAHPEQALDRCHKRRTTKLGIEGEHFTQEQFRSLCEYYGNKCLKCGRTDVPLTADHVIPLSMKVPHSDEIENIQPLCRSCNSSKHAKTVDYRKS